MTITEKSDYSLVIMKDSEDPYWISMREFEGEEIMIYGYDTNKNVSYSHYLSPKDFVCNARMLIAYFDNKVPDEWSVYDRVIIFSK